MDKKTAALLGAAGCIALSAPTSYAELLNPVHDAVEVLKADNAAQAARVQPAAWTWNGYSWQWQDYPPNYHHHHHHHHHHHSHHHHHHGGYWVEER